jgi:biopolymer transport protein ExbD
MAMPMRARPDLEPATSDMTPMIDVVFLMIVFFVCIDFRVLEAKLPAYLPRDVGGRGDAVEPQEQLIVQVRVTEPGQARTTGPAHDGRPPRQTLVGHRVEWAVGPRRFVDLDAARQELTRLAADPKLLVPDPSTGGRKRMRVVVEGAQDARYDDIARAADACHSAGFDELTFGIAAASPRRG